jgi:acyl-coenzyme A synthetase/AMP-(fatty) acid ligase
MHELIARDQRTKDALARWTAEGYYSGRSMGHAISEGLDAHPDDRLIFASQSRPSELTLCELRRSGARVAAGLHRLGLRRGDVLVGQVPQWAEQAELWYACTLLGLVYVPVIHIYGDAELGFIVRDSRAKAVAMPDLWRKIDYRSRFEAMRAEPTVEHLIVVGDSEIEGSVPWSALGAPAGDLPLPDPAIDPDDPVIVLYTSGTTSAPKGVVHSSNSFLAEFVTSAPILDRGPSGVVLDVSPAGHMASLIGVTRPLLYSSNVTLFMDKWDPDVAIKLIDTYQVTSSGGPPYFLTTLLDLADSRGDRMESLQDFALGGSAVPEPLARRAEARGIRTYRMYGSTEHPTVSVGHPNNDADLRITTDGALQPGTRVRVVDEDDRDVPHGVEGEILTVGPELMIGYTDPAANRAAFDPMGFFRTGDLGTLSEAGVLRITGRKKDIIIRGGETLSALEIEEVLMRHPAVQEASVIAVPDPVFVERVCAVVSLRPGAQLDLAGVADHFEASGVARQKTPERLVVIDALPHTATGKVRKQDLKQMVRDA